MPDPVLCMVRRSISSTYTDGYIHLFGFTCRSEETISQKFSDLLRSRMVRLTLGSDNSSPTI